MRKQDLHPRDDPNRFETTGIRLRCRSNACQRDYEEDDSTVSGRLSNFLQCGFVRRRGNGFRGKPRAPRSSRLNRRHRSGNCRGYFYQSRRNLWFIIVCFLCDIETHRVISIILHFFLQGIHSAMREILESFAVVSFQGEQLPRRRF